MPRRRAACEHANRDVVGGRDHRRRGFARRGEAVERVRPRVRIVRRVQHVLVAWRHAEVGQPLDEPGDPLAHVDQAALADESEPAVTEAGEVIDGGVDAAAVVDVQRVHALDRVALPQRHRRDAGGGEVVEQAGLVAHVAEQDDRVAVPGLEHGVQLDRLVGRAVGAAEHDVVVALAGTGRHRLDHRREEGVGDLAHDDAEQHRGGPAQARASGLGRYPRRPAASMTRARVTSAIGTLVAVRLRTRDTVDCDTPDKRAMSCIVTVRSGASSSTADTRPIPSRQCRRQAVATNGPKASVARSHTVDSIAMHA